jgi:multidrug efflux pump subunit AcrB
MLNSNLQGNYWKTIWIITAIIGLYYTIVIIFSYNFPISDDFALLEFVTNTVTSSDLTRNLRLLYIQHNEHIIITTKLIYLLDYWLFDELNFNRLILIGNIFHLGTFYIFIKHSPKNFKQQHYLFIFSACMIFQFGSAESMLWSMAAISNYLVIMLALFKLIPVTLTAAGIAGFIITIGMAVDANILIFERMKEELAQGRGIWDAMHEGFARAWLSIRDSNISSIITGIILYKFGSTSVVTGFALVFIIGVLVSMFTAITASRIMLYAISPSRTTRWSTFFISNGFGHWKS